ncbi:MAG: hypothetical protein DYH08_02185 [Actinobacteria bacterium ATB1]|nr:hypothetical protein [Actinobacteria bacterium ATB1]
MASPTPRRSPASSPSCANSSTTQPTPPSTPPPPLSQQSRNLTTGACAPPSYYTKDGTPPLRWLLWRNWEDLTPQQRERLDILAATHGRLHRAWQLKEVLRQIFQLPYLEAKMQLNDWLAWASRSRIPAFVKLARRIR